jgi:hypothetical protein
MLRQARKSFAAPCGTAMETDEEKAIRYRYRAQEIRALIALAQDAKIRKALIVVATYYENMAMVLEDGVKH